MLSASAAVASGRPPDFQRVSAREIAKPRPSTAVRRSLARKALCVGVAANGWAPAPNGWPQRQARCGNQQDTSACKDQPSGAMPGCTYSCYACYPHFAASAINTGGTGSSRWPFAAGIALGESPPKDRAQHPYPSCRLDQRQVARGWPRQASLLLEHHALPGSPRFHLASRLSRCVRAAGPPGTAAIGRELR